MSDNARVSLLFFANLLLYFIIGELNNFSSAYSIFLHLDTLPLVFFGLYLNRQSSLIFTALLGLLADAVTPAPQGTYLAGYLAIWLFFIWCQRRIRRQNPAHMRLVTIAAQVIWVALLSLMMGGASLVEWVYWQRILADLIISTCLIYLFVWPWCSFQKKLLYSLGWDLDAQVTRI